jgi:hypothetical protein
MRHLLCGRLALAATILATADVASASTFTYSGYSVANEQNIQILTPNDIYGGSGQIALQGSGPNAGETIFAWCLDVFTYLAGSGTYTVGPLTIAGSGSPNPTLTPQQIGEIGGLINYGNTHINASYDVSSAIQIAIWMVEYGNAFSYSGTSVSDSNLALQYYTEVTGGALPLDENVSLLSESNNQYLAFLSPLPSTWTMMLIGLAGIGLYFSTRRHLQKPVPSTP